MNTLEILRVGHPEVSLGQLSDMIVAHTDPVRRSTHIGNQPARELLVMTALPPGIDVMTVDTIQGNDNYSRPHDVVLDGSASPLCERKESKGKRVGSVAITKLGEEKNRDARLNELVVKPQVGESLASFHSRAIEALKPNNPPTPMTEYFTRTPDLYQAVLATSLVGSDTTRSVTADGQIIVIPALDAQQGIFGIDDRTPATEGLLPSLDVMMAMDALITMIEHGADRTIHLGSVDMVRYTRDEQRMHKIGTLIARTAAELDIKIAPHQYDVVDITGLDNLVSTATHASQHQLLRVRHALQIDLEEHAAMPCGQSRLVTA